MKEGNDEKVSRRLRLEQLAKDDVSSQLSRATEEPGGLEDNELRKLAWPVLLAPNETPLKQTHVQQSGLRQRGSKRQKTEHEPTGSLLEKARSLPAHSDENQVRLDVERSFVSLLEGADKSVKAKRREQLQEIIVAVLRLHPQLHYFQGFHDIVSVCLLVLDDPEETLAFVERLSLFRIRDSMGATIEPVMGYLRLLRRILRAKDPAFAAVVERAANLPYFSLSWVLTLLSHDIPDLASSARLFDFVLSHNPAMMSYLAAALVLEKRGAVDDLQQDPDFADDPAMLHTTLSKLPSLSPTAFSPPTNQTSVKEKEDIAYWSDPDVSTPAFQEIRPVVIEPATLSVDDLITRTLELWTAYPLHSTKIRVKELFGHNSCIFTYDKDLSVEEAESIVASGKDVVKQEPAKVAKLPFKRPLQILLRRHMLVTAVGTLGLGIVLATVFGSERKAVFESQILLDHGGAPVNVRPPGASRWSHCILFGDASAKVLSRLEFASCWRAEPLHVSEHVVRAA